MLKACSTDMNEVVAKPCSGGKLSWRMIGRKTHYNKKLTRTHEFQYK